MIAEWVYTLYPFYTIHDLVAHPAVVMLPYSVMSYRFTELYALAIPIFVPSPKFYLEYYDPGTKMFGIGWDRTSTKRPMCSTDSKLEDAMRQPLNRLYSLIFGFCIDICSLYSITFKFSIKYCNLCYFLLSARLYTHIVQTLICPKMQSQKCIGCNSRIFTIGPMYNILTITNI